MKKKFWGGAPNSTIAALISVQLLLDCMYPYRNHMETTCFANGATSEFIWAPIKTDWSTTGFSCR